MCIDVFVSVALFVFVCVCKRLFRLVQQQQKKAVCGINYIDSVVSRMSKLSIEQVKSKKTNTTTSYNIYSYII